MANLDETEQREIWDVAEEVYKANKDEHIALDPKLMAAGRRILKKNGKRSNGNCEARRFCEVEFSEPHGRLRRHLVSALGRRLAKRVDHFPRERRIRRGGRRCRRSSGVTLTLASRV
jgi:hypothetical protein